MRVSDFQYDLPAELIAQYPLESRTASRLMLVNRHVEHSFAEAPFTAFIDQLNEGDLLVINDARVIPARLHGKKSTGGRVEVLLERIIGEERLLAQVRASKTPKPGNVLFVDHSSGNERLEVLGRQGDFFELATHDVDNLYDWLERVGHSPLPPYIDRADTDLDKQRYQTVYAEKRGAVAAPTAGLHFDEKLLAAISAKGVGIEKVTLHVGAGTFQPVRVDDTRNHHMHSEQFEVGEKVAAAVNKTKLAGGRIIAIGTTSVRALESAASDSKTGEVIASSGDTDIFITPGYDFRVVDALLTNFHLPGSTLIMLVSAFAGSDLTMQAYNKAVEDRFRFFSYGDAMFIS